MKVEIKKTLLGKLVVAYDCLSCGQRLHSPSTDISKQDYCPTCVAEFKVPGKLAIERIRERQELEIS